MAEHNLYIVYVQRNWGVFSDSTCPDLSAFPNHYYQSYSVPENKLKRAFKKLLKIKKGFEKRNIKPQKNKNIFPGLEDLI